MDPKFFPPPSHPCSHDSNSFSSHSSSSFSSLEDLSTTHFKKGYKISLKYEGTDTTLEELKKTFSESRAQLTISVGCSKKHYGEYFKASLEKAAKDFKDVVIMVDDSVQWRTLAIEIEDSEKRNEANLRDIADKNAEDWFSENQQYIDACKEKYPGKIKLIRWKDFDAVEVQRAVNEMTQIYHNNERMRIAIDQTAAEFLERVRRRNPPVPSHCTDEDILMMSRNYLIEECGVMRKIWPKYHAQYELYPAKRTRAMEETHRLYIQEQNLLTALIMNIHPKKSNSRVSQISDTNPENEMQERSSFGKRK